MAFRRPPGQGCGGLPLQHSLSSSSSSSLAGLGLAGFSGGGVPSSSSGLDGAGCPSSAMPMPMPMPMSDAMAYPHGSSSLIHLQQQHASLPPLPPPPHLHSVHHHDQQSEDSSAGSTPFACAAAGTPGGAVRASPVPPRLHGVLPFGFGPPPPPLLTFLNLDQEVGCVNLTHLDPLNEETVLSNLFQRFKRDQIYTYLGEIVVSVNPYYNLALYSTQVMQAYHRRCHLDLPPHIFALSDQAYRGITDFNEDQVIMISGESGSGKTEAAKQVLRYVTNQWTQNSSNHSAPVQSATSVMTHQTQHTSRTPPKARRPQGFFDSQQQQGSRGHYFSHHHQNPHHQQQQQCDLQSGFHVPFHHGSSSSSTSASHHYFVQQQQQQQQQTMAFIHHQQQQQQQAMMAGNPHHSGAGSRHHNPTSTPHRERHQQQLFDGHLTTVRDRLLSTCPLLEAFGNAKTQRNDNSSRFGKYMEIEFDYRGSPVGGTITNYLLEKSRVTSFPSGERNFHIFYQLLQGADVHLLKSLRLQRNPDNYDFLRRNAKHQHMLESRDDKQDFILTKRALEILEFDVDEVNAVLGLVASVLKLGNVSFLPSNNIDGTEGCAVTNDYELHDLCHLLGTTYEELLNCLTTRTIWTEVPVGSAAGGSGRDTPSTTTGSIAGNVGGSGNVGSCHMVYRGGAKSGCGSSESVPPSMPSAATSPATSHRQLSSAVVAAGSRQQLNRATSFSRAEMCSEGICDTNPYPVRSGSGAVEWTSGGTLPSMSSASRSPPPSMGQRGAASGSRVDCHRMDVVVADLSASEACQTRSLLARAIYNRLFSWLITRLNDALRPKHPGKWRLLGLLDIYGFEVFESNSFEQLIINFCNEKLHQSTVEVTLKQEQEEYIREGLDWEPIDYRNNNNICELIERNNHGILSLLDEESLRTRGQATDDTFLLKLTQVCSGHPNFESRGMKTFLADETLPQHCFRVRHYAGNVMYSVHGFLEKNGDTLPRDLSHAMYRCNNFLLKAMFPEGNPKRAHLKKSATAGAQFKISMGALLKSLSQKTPRFIRCIKPNELKQPKKFEYALVQHQVRYLGLVDQAKVKRQGFALRMTYQSFLERYKMLSLQTWPVWRGGCPQEGVMCLLRDLAVSPTDYAYGRSKVFIHSPRTVCDLEEFRYERLYDLATLIQKTWRGYHAKVMLDRMMDCQIRIAAVWRGYMVRRRRVQVEKRHHADHAALIVQRCYFCWRRRQWLIYLARRLPSSSPLCKDWPPCPRRFTEASILLRKLHHKWRCHIYRMRFDQTARNRMREKVTASIIFKDRKASYPRSVSHPFLGDYVRLRQNVQWKKMCVDTNDQYVVFADIINKINRSSGRFVPVLFVVSTSAMLILDQRTMQIKYRVPATDIYRLSLSPFFDDIAVVHVKVSSPTSENSAPHPNVAPPPASSNTGMTSGCLFQADMSRRKGDFVFQTGHVIEIITKLFLVVQNATGKPPEVNIATEFEANFVSHAVLFTFRATGHQQDLLPGQVKISKKGQRMEIVL